MKLGNVQKRDRGVKFNIEPVQCLSRSLEKLNPYGFLWNELLYNEDRGRYHCHGQVTSRPKVSSIL
jgi:hypothetical protein